MVPPSAQEISAAHVAGLSQADMTDYWWFAVRQDHVRQAMRASAAADAGCELRYLDLGCGTGGAEQGLRLAQIPVRWRHEDGSKVRLLSSVCRSFADLLRIRWRRMRGRYR